MISDDATARAFICEIGGLESEKRLESFAKLLIAENARQNLVARSTLESVWVRHFADSAQIFNHVPRETPEPWLDIGSGAGFPGLVLAALSPTQPMVLVEPRKKRSEWLQATVWELGLVHVRVIKSNLEAIDMFTAGVITARAVAPLEKLLTMSGRFSTRCTHWVLPKGRNAPQELASLPRARQKMFHVEQSLTDQRASLIVGTGKID